MSGLTIGAFSVGRVTELEFPAFLALEFFPAATAEMVEQARRELPGRISSDGKIVMSFHSFVLMTGRCTILIDTCCAKSRPGREQFDKGKRDFFGGLAALGVKPEGVTHVMCTHLHWDHVGWNTQRVDGQGCRHSPTPPTSWQSANTTTGTPSMPARRAEARTSMPWRSRTACCQSCGLNGRCWCRTISSWIPACLWSRAMGTRPAMSSSTSRPRVAREFSSATPCITPCSCCSPSSHRAPTAT